MTELHDLLERATDRMEAPDLAARALTTASGRRARRRGLAAAGAAAVLVAAVAVAGSFEHGGVSRPTGPLPSPDPDHPDERVVTAQAWDPRSVDDLDRVTWPGLPSTVDVPGSAPYLGDEPLPAAWLVVSTRLPENDGGLFVLGVDGSWRSLPDGGLGAPAPSLSRDGTRLLVPLADGGAQVWELADGMITLPEPQGWVPWDFESWTWVSPTTVLADDGEGGWLVDVSSGSAQQVDAPRSNPGTWAAGPDGELLEGSGLNRPVATDGWLAGTTYTDGSFRVEVRGRDDDPEVYRLEIEDDEGNYSNWALRVATVTRDGTVLLWVAVPGDRAGEDGWRLVSWRPGTGDLGLVATSDADPTWSTWFALDRLAELAP